MINPFSTISVGKRILSGLNKSGPLSNMIEHYWYEKHKIKTSSVVSFGLRPLIKFEDIKAKDSLFSLWAEPDKYKLKSKSIDDSDLLAKYIDFSITKIRDLFIAFKSNMDADQWKTYTSLTSNGILSVSFTNGVLNVLRLLIENNKVSSVEDYQKKLLGINKFPFKNYKSSQYRKMGEEIYKTFFNKK